MTGAELIEDVCGPLGWDKADTTIQTRVLRWLNESKNDIAEVYDWPVLVTRDASLALSGAASYDLTTGVGNPGSTFFRIVGDTVRCGTYILRLRTKAWRDSVDPARTQTGTAGYFGIEGRTYFWVFPNQSSGTLYYDWMAYPSDITASSTEAQVPLGKEKHGLILYGAQWRGKKYIGDTDWLAEKKEWELDVRKKSRSSAAVRVTSGNTTPITNIDF